MFGHINLSNDFGLIWPLSLRRWRPISLLWPSLNVTAIPRGVHRLLSQERAVQNTFVFFQFPPRGTLKQSFSILSLFCLDLSRWPLHPPLLWWLRNRTLLHCFIVYNTRKLRHLGLYYIQPSWTLCERVELQSRVCFSFVSWEAGIDWMSSGSSPVWHYSQTTLVWSSWITCVIIPHNAQIINTQSAEIHWFQTVWSYFAVVALMCYLFLIINWFLIVFHSSWPKTRPDVWAVWPQKVERAQWPATPSSLASIGRSWSVEK